MAYKNRIKATLCCLTAGILAACSFQPQKAGPTPYDKTMVADCYTVDLFTEAKVKTPKSDVPEAWRGFSGTWGKAGWEGKWCHDLHILEINSDGSVVLMELHAPYAPWGKSATAFRRKGWISKDGRLRVAYSGVNIEYWMENGRLYGKRKQGDAEMRIALSQGTNSKFGG